MKTLTQKLERKINPEIEDKYFSTFSREARYKGNGVYFIGSIFSTDTRELFLMYVAAREGIKYKND